MKCFVYNHNIQAFLAVMTFPPTWPPLSENNNGRWENLIACAHLAVQETGIWNRGTSSYILCPTSQFPGETGSALSWFGPLIRTVNADKFISCFR